MNTIIHPRKISILVSNLSSSASGRWGGGVRPFLVAEALQRMGHQVTIFGLGLGSQTPRFSSTINIVYIPCEYHSGIVSASKELLGKIDGDIIYAMKLRTTSFGLGIIKKLTSRSPLILDIDDWEMGNYGGKDWKFGFKPIKFIREMLNEDGELRYPDHPLYLSWLERFTSYADVITTHNTFLQQKFGGVYIPQGKDLSYFNPGNFDGLSVKKKYGLANYRVLMFLGMVDPDQGLEELLSAMESLDWEDLKLVIVGDTLDDEYGQYLLQKWSRWLVTIPPQPYEMMPEVISCADVMVMPQKHSPRAITQFPLKLADAMAMAKPILATKVGDVPEILQDTGYLVDSATVENFTQGLKTIFDSYEEALQKGLQARDRYYRYYSISQMMFMFDQILQGL